MLWLQILLAVEIHWEDQPSEQRTLMVMQHCYSSDKYHVQRAFEVPGFQIPARAISRWESASAAAETTRTVKLMSNGCAWDVDQRTHCFII